MAKRMIPKNSPEKNHPAQANTIMPVQVLFSQCFHTGHLLAVKNYLSRLPGLTIQVKTIPECSQVLGFEIWNVGLRIYRKIQVQTVKKATNILSAYTMLEFQNSAEILPQPSHPEVALKIISGSGLVK